MTAPFYPRVEVSNEVLAALLEFQIYDKLESAYEKLVN